MFQLPLASQTGWLYPFAAIALACGLLWRRGRPRTDRLRAGFLLWGSWLVTYVLVFSAGNVGAHTYYMGVVALPLAALTGAGVTVLWRAHRAGGPRAWALPAAVGATALWAAWICFRFSGSFAPWLGPLVLLTGIVAFVLLVPRLRTGRTAFVGLATGLLALLLAPAAWASQVFAGPAHGGMSGMMGSVGPTSPNGGPGGRIFAAGRFRTTGSSGSFPGRADAGTYGSGHAGRTGGRLGTRFGGGFGDSGAGTLTPAQKHLLAYADAHRGTAEYAFAATSWRAASPFILADGTDVLPIGGFTGQVPFPTPSAFRALVRAGRVRYVLADGGRPGFGGTFRGASGGSASAEISAWVTSRCTIVPAVSGLYDCRSAR